MPGVAKYAARSLAALASIFGAKKPIPPTLLEIAFKIVEGEFAPFNTLLTLAAGVAVWHIAQFAE